MPKKSTKSKPIASSTPDGQNSKSVPLTSANKKRNLSCDISPVTTHVNMSGSDERKDSPKRWEQTNFKWWLSVQLSFIKSIRKKNPTRLCNDRICISYNISERLSCRPRRNVQHLRVSKRTHLAFQSSWRRRGIIHRLIRIIRSLRSA